jgi:hypothetical protein
MPLLALRTPFTAATSELQEPRVFRADDDKLEQRADLGPLLGPRSVGDFLPDRIVPHDALKPDVPVGASSITASAQAESAAALGAAFPSAARAVAPFVSADRPAVEPRARSAAAA